MKQNRHRPKRRPLRPRLVRYGGGLVVVVLLSVIAAVRGVSTPAVNFAGLDQLSERDARAMIEHQLEWIAKDGASPALADDAAYFLERAMRSRGFPTADVSLSSMRARAK